MNRVLLAGLAALLAGCVSIEVETAPTPASIAVATNIELDAANIAFSRAWVAGDVGALMDAYTEDAILHPPAGGVLTTRDEVRRALTPSPDAPRVGHRLEPSLRRALAADTILEMGRWHASVTRDGAAPWRSGCYTVIWRDEHGRWRMQYDAWGPANDASWACRPR